MSQPASARSALADALLAAHLADDRASLVPLYTRAADQAEQRSDRRDASRMRCSRYSASLWRGMRIASLR